jgi:hypothetical protein
MIHRARQSDLSGACVGGEREGKSALFYMGQPVRGRKTQGGATLLSSPLTNPLLSDRPENVSRSLVSRASSGA